MLGYDYEVVYRKGSRNLAADALSKKPKLREGQFLQLTGSSISSDLLARVQASYVVDSKVQKLCAEVQQQGQSHPKYSWDGRFLRRKGKIVVGDVAGLKLELFQLFHESTIGGHSGVHATRKRLTGYWKGLTADVKKWVKECLVCQRCNSETVASPGLLQPLPIPDRAWSSISMDFIEGLPNSRGKTAIFVVDDRLTKYAHFVALAHPFTVVTVVLEFMDNIYKLHGMPESKSSSVISDKISSKSWALRCTCPQPITQRLMDKQR